MKGLGDMLFGTRELQEKLIKEIRQCEIERNIKVVYGAVLGSISRGLQLPDSDYDTRFIYIRNDFPNKIMKSEELPEQEVIYRKPLEHTCFEQISLWEMTAFMRYMIHSSIDGKFSVGLYNVVGHTLLSPYTWDPYGLQLKIVPLIQKFFHKPYYIWYHRNELLGNNSENIVNSSRGNLINAKEYLKILWTAVSIDYAIRYNEFPPIYMKTLLQIIPDEVQSAAILLIEEMHQVAGKYIEEDNADTCHKASKATTIKRVKVIDDYIEKIKEQIKDFELVYLDQDRKSFLEKKMQEIYKIVQYSVYDEVLINEKW